MNGGDVQRLMDELHNGHGGWVDPCHIATSAWRPDAMVRLNHDPFLAGAWGDNPLIALVELYLTEALPGIQRFAGIFAVDELGIWYYDGDGNVRDPVWRQHLLPWRYVRTLILHQVS